MCNMQKIYKHKFSQFIVEIFIFLFTILDFVSEFSSISRLGFLSRLGFHCNL